MGSMPDDSAFVRGMLDPAAYPHPVGEIQLVETHISWVFLTGPFVYKVKKPCVLGFLDFSTLERRRHFCHEEVRVSGRFAPNLYLGVVPITGCPDRPRVAGAGAACEWAVKLAQFDERHRLDALFTRGRLDAADCERLGADIAAVQATLPAAAPDAAWGTVDSMGQAARLNIGQIRALRPDMAGRAEAAGGWLERRLEALRPLIASRKTTGRVRECHGDLHLANIVLHDGRMTPFDAIEFSEPLRWIDVAADIAFLTMDLESRSRADLAAHVASAWMEAADDHAAAAVLPVYEVYRAIVRAAVAAIRGGQEAGAAAERSRAETERYLDLAATLGRPRRAVLFATSGVSGSGKTTVAAALVGAGRAMRLRSDVERKRLAGMAATDRPGDAEAARALYGADMTRRVYDRLATLARTVLAAGTSVVVDATCNHRWQRDLFARSAHALGVPLVWLDFDVPSAELLARVAARAAHGHDASDALAEVVRAQLASREPLTAAETLAAGAVLVRVAPPELADPSFATRVASLSTRDVNRPA